MKKLFLFGMVAACSMLFGGPDDMVLKSGDYKFVYDLGAKAKCSVVQIFYKDAELGTRTGWHGNVFAPASGKYIGAGHTEGGSEQVLEKSMTVDGAPAEIKPGEVSAKEIVLKKTSMLGNFKLNITWTLNESGMKVDKQFEAVADQQAHQFYIYQICWNKLSSDYLLFRKDGSIKNEAFQPVNTADRKVTWPVYGERDAFCVSQYLPESKAAHLTFMANFGCASGINMIWNVNAYHKYYYWMDLPKLVPAGYKSPVITMLIRGFNAENKEEWAAKATAIKDELLAQYPFLSRFEHFTTSPLVLPPSPDKQQIHKVALPLEKDTTYNISFEICKTPEMSKYPNHHYAFVGYYDQAAKKYPQLCQLGHTIKPDSEFHKVQGAFKTPAEKQDLFVYIYNSNSTGTLTIKNMVIEKQK